MFFHPNKTSLKGIFTLSENPFGVSIHDPTSPNINLYICVNFFKKLR